MVLKILHKSTKSFWLMIILLIAASSGIIWANYRFVSQDQVGYKFYELWVETSNFILNGISPYSGVTFEENSEISKGFEVQISNNAQFDFPLYTYFLLIPFSVIRDYKLAVSLWMTILEISMISLGIMTIKNVGWKIKSWMIPFVLIFSIFIFQGTYAIINGSLTILVGFFIILCLSSIRQENSLATGFFLALTTISPKLIILVIVFVLFWAITCRNWSLVGWFFFWLLLLIGTAMLFIPDWLLQNIRAVVANGWNLSEGGLGSIYTAWLPGIGNQLRWLTIIGISLLLVIEWWLASSKDFRHFLWTVVLTLTLSNLIGFTSNIGDVVLLLIPLILVLSIIDDRYHHWGIYAVTFLILIIFFISWALAIFLPDSGWRISILALMNIPISLIVFVGLYWIRWWTIRAPIKSQ